MRTIPQYSCSVIPPHMTRHIAEHGDDADRQAIESTIAQSEELHQERRSPETFLVAQQPAPAAPFVPHRNLYDAEHRRTLPGKQIATGNRAPNPLVDVEASEAWNGAGVAYRFCLDVFSRNSMDGRGMPINSSVRYGVNFDNATWNGKQMVYGSGDGKLFNRFTIALDVIGHELMHGYTQYIAELEYWGESGALNEHFSDAVGIMIKQYHLDLDAGESDWLIGAGLFTPRVNGKAVRSMAQPGTAYDDPVLGRDPQPAHMRDYVHTEEDSGGVHINSGIPNRAFYLAATGVGGKAWKVVGPIWYAALKRLRPNATIQDHANATFTVAGTRFGSLVQRIVGNAWRQVGLEPSTTH